MKKFFRFFLLILTPIILFSKLSLADVRSITEPPVAQSTDVKKKEDSLRKLYKEIPDLNDKEALKKYIEKRLKIAMPAKISKDDVTSSSSISIVDTNNPSSNNQSQTLSAYEKIYQDSLKRATTSDTPLNADTKIEGNFYELVHDRPETEPFVPDFPYVTIKLSDEREILAPAEEHIAYLLTTIKVESTGLMKVSEEFVFVSNNEYFPEGFFRILPKYNYARNGAKRRYDLTLDSVTINDEKYPYKVTEIGNYLHIEPEKPLHLPTGIYTYRFNYLIDRAVWFYDNFDEFYWDITARTLRNVVGSANAVIILPTGSQFLAQNAIANTKKGINHKRVTITSLNQNALAFADTEALDIGDDIHLFITLDKGTLLTPDFARRYFWFIQDHGAVLFALLALLAIYFAYKISLMQIKQNKDKTRANLRKSPAIFRLLNNNAFDARSLLAELLELKAKGIVNLEQHNGESVLVKNTDNLKKLPKAIQKFVNLLFPGAETALPSSALSSLKLKRAYKYLHRLIYREYNTYIFKLNGLYLAFSVAMLLCGIIASSSIAINPWHTFWVIVVCTILMVPYMILYNIHFNRKWLNVLVKLLAAISILGISSWLSIYTSTFYAALIIITLSLIIYYYKTFARRNGLLRNKIKETEEYKSFLQKNTDLAISARDFATKEPYIYAFGIENKYKGVETFNLIQKYETILTNAQKKD